MSWFDDVWMKEVFANFIAAKIIRPIFPSVNHDLRFLVDHYPPVCTVWIEHPVRTRSDKSFATWMRRAPSTDPSFITRLRL